MTQTRNYEILSIKYHQILIEFPINTRFESIEEFMRLFSKSTASKGVSFKVKQRHKKHATLACPTEGCEFKVSVNFNTRFNQCVIRHMNPFHAISCGCDDVSKSCVLKTVVHESNIQVAKPADIITAMRSQKSVPVKYSAVYKAIRRCKMKQNVIIADA